MKNFLFIFIFNIIFGINFTLAIVINEIMYDPAGSDTNREWIEIYNNTQEAINLENYKLFEANINHSIILKSGNKIINPNEYAVIANNPNSFLIDYPNFSGNLFDSVFSLSNSGELLEIRLNTNTIDSLTYIPNAQSNGTGRTLSKIDNIWKVGLATPGALNIEYTQDQNQNSTSTINTNNNSNSTSSATSTNSNNNNSNQSSTSTQSNQFNQSNQNSSFVNNVTYSKRTYILGDLKLLIPKEIYSIVGSVTNFEIRSRDSKGRVNNYDVYWSFGDGSGAMGATTTNIYHYPGVFDVFVEVDTKDAFGIDRIKVFVREPLLEVIATSSGVLIYNHDEEDIDIGNFNIHCSNGIFKIARHLLIERNKSILIHNNTLGFSCFDPKLFFPNNTLVKNYIKYRPVNNLIIENISNSNSTSTNLNNSTSSQIQNQYNTKLYSSNFSQKNIKNSNLKKISTTTKELTKVSTSTILDQKPLKNEVVEKSVSKNFKKWLYWLYE